MVEVVLCMLLVFFFFQAEDGIRDHCVTGVQTCALPIWAMCGRGMTLSRVRRPLTAVRRADRGSEDSLAGNGCRKFRSEEHTSDSSHTVISYAVFCLKKKKKKI